MKIIGIGGSLRSPSYTYMALKIAMNHAQALGAEIETIDLRSLKLPFCNGQSEYRDFPDVLHLRDKFKDAQGVILATPEYHGEISGVLKNTLDLLDLEHLEGKAIGIIGVLGGISSANAVNSIRIICRHLHAWVIPEQVIVPYADKAFNDQEELIENDHTVRIQTMVESLIKTINKLM